MANTAILTKAIQKAIGGGWKVDWIAKDAFRVWDLIIEPLGDDTNGLETPCVEYDLAKPTEFIFNHDFAKALWGDKSVYMADCIESPEEGAAGFQENYDAWEFHLREMVIAEDPIKYLGEHLGGN